MILDKSAPSTAGKGFVPLFNGKDLTGWENVFQNGSEWKVTDDGLLEGRKGGEGKPALLVTQRTDFSNFRLRIKFRYRTAGAGKVEIRRSRVGDNRSCYLIHHGVWPTTAKWQIPVGTVGKLSNRPYSDGGPGRRAENTKVAKTVSVPLDTWNVLDITAVRKRVTVLINEQTVNEFIDTSGWYANGEIALTAWVNSVVQFKEVLIEELPDVPDRAGGAALEARKSNVADGLKAGSTWAGVWSYEDPGYLGRKQWFQLLVTERSDRHFKAEALYTRPESGWSLRANVEGTIQGERIEYQEVGKESWRFSSLGAISNGVIKLKFQGTGTGGNSRFGGGEITLQK
jgi:Domain of Unknown Function (DUF1080)